MSRREGFRRQTSDERARPRNRTAKYSRSRVTTCVGLRRAPFLSFYALMQPVCADGRHADRVFSGHATDFPSWAHVCGVWYTVDRYRLSFVSFSRAKMTVIPTYNININEGNAPPSAGGSSMAGRPFSFPPRNKKQKTLPPMDLLHLVGMFPTRIMSAGHFGWMIAFAPRQVSALAPQSSLTTHASRPG